MVCYVCHKEGHKSYECKVKNGGGAKKKEKKQTSKLSNTYTNKVDKKASTPYKVDKKVSNTYTNKVDKKVSNTDTNKVDPEREVRSPMDLGEFGDLAKYGCISWGASLLTR